jgi:hypothetical protein
MTLVAAAGGPTKCTGSAAEPVRNRHGQRGYDWPIRRLCTLVLFGLSLAACGSDPPLPAACSDEPAKVRAALRAAPASVRLEGTRLSSCVHEASDADELQAVGAALVTTAGSLADSARRDPGGKAELSLGYLVGAARRGARPQGGERTELVRRLEQEATGLRGSRASYRRGGEAGERSG